MNKLHKVYGGKTVIITGHTGFKGSWLSIWLTLLGAKVIGISNAVPTSRSNFAASNVPAFIEDHRLDVRDINGISKIIEEKQPDFIFHLAAQALVRPSYESPFETLSVNALGSAAVLEALRCSATEKKVVAVMITSDKAYDNLEWKWGYRETDSLGGKDPYSASKGMAELAIRSYTDSFFDKVMPNVSIGITRAGNVIGGGDWALDRIVPDCVNAWSMDEQVSIRSPLATRPWQHVLEPLSGYLALGAELVANPALNGEAYNFGPNSNQNHSVSHLIDEMAKHWDKVRWIDDSNNSNAVHEAGLLKLNCDKALFDLKWKPTLEFKGTVQLTIEWYKKYYQNIGGDMHDFTVSQILSYADNAKKLQIDWALND